MILAVCFTLRGHDTLNDLPSDARAFSSTSFAASSSLLRLDKVLRFFHFLQSAAGSE